MEPSLDGGSGEPRQTIEHAGRGLDLIPVSRWRSMRIFPQYTAFGWLQGVFTRDAVLFGIADHRHIEADLCGGFRNDFAVKHDWIFVHIPARFRFRSESVPNPHLASIFAIVTLTMAAMRGERRIYK